LAELRAHPDFEAEARQRWVEWYLNFSERYGGRDRLEMHLRYDYLEGDWDNILTVMRWCQAEVRYDSVLALWNNVRDFTHIYGFWADRLSLLDWLIVEADNRRDYTTQVQLMYDRAFTLTITGTPIRLKEAESLLNRCWSLRQHARSALQARVAALMGSLCIHLERHGEAHQWLDIGEELLSTSDLEPIELARERTSLLYDRGENYLTTGEYGKAQGVFREMLEQGERSSWQRSVAYAQNWLAYTALLQKNADLSKEYLWQGWPVASRIKEKRLIAFFKRTFAYYYHEVGNHDEALKWAEDALDTFERLAMPPDIRRMQTLIAQLKGN
jgi:LuxR family glucitol operon transcriptional activator